MALLASCTDTSGASSTGTTLAGPATVPVGDQFAFGQGAGTFRVYADDALNFQALLGLGSSGFTASPGEIVTVANAVNAEGAPGGPGSYRAYFEAMLDMDDGQARKVSLNGPLVEQAQATLARMRVAERAYTLLKSEAHNAEVEDWIASQRGGPDMNLVFEAANGAGRVRPKLPG